MMPMQLEPPAPSKYYGPFDARQKLMNLQNLAQQHQEGQQRLQMGQQALAEHQRSLARQQSIDQAYKDAFIVGDDGTPQLDQGKFSQALSAAGHGSAIPGILEGQAKLDTTYADLRKKRSDIAAAEQEAAGTLGASVQAAKNDPNVFLTLMTHAVHSGAIGKEHVAPLIQQVQSALEEDPTGEKARAVVEQATNMMVQGSNKQRELQTARVTADSTALRNTAQANLANVGTEQKQLELAGQTAPDNQKQWDAWRGGLPPAIQQKIPQFFSPTAAELVRRMGLTLDQRRQGDQAAATLAEQKLRDQQTKAHETVTEGQRNQELGIQRSNAKRMQAQFDATYGALLGPNGEQLSPDAMKAVAMQDPAAVAVANYQVAPPTMSRGGPGAAVLRKVLAINPTYNAQNWQAQQAMMKGYTSGAQSKEIGGINTALGHVAALGEAIDALNNSDLQFLNRMANYLGVQTGGDAVTTFKAIVHKVAPEINRAYVGGVGSQGEIMSQESDFDPKLGDKQLRSNVAITAKLLRSKIGSLENQWKQTMGSDFAARFMMPEAQHAIDKWAPEGSTPAPAGGGRGGATPAPAGGRGATTYPPLPATLSPSDVGKTYKSPKTGKNLKITAVNPQNGQQFQSQEVP